MRFLRRWLLIFSALVLGGGQLFAASREDRAYTAAVAAFQDEVWDRADTEFAQFLDRFPKSGHRAEAVLFQAQARFKQGKFADVIALLNVQRDRAGALADRYAYWVGEAQFAQGDFAAAVASFTALAGAPAESSLKLTAAVEAANALEKLGDARRLEEWLTATNGIFARTAELDAANELVARGRLLLAQSRYARQNFSGALEILKRLNPRSLPPDLDWQRLYLVARAKLGAGEFDGALAATTNLLAAQKNPVRVADALALRGTILEKLGQPAAAISTWSESLAGGAPAARQQEAILKISALALAQNNISDAVAGLEKYLARGADPQSRDLALFTLGELNLKNFSDSNHLDLAQARFNQLLVSSNGTPLAARAFLDRGWCRWLAGDAAASLADFQAAAGHLPESEEQAVAKFKAGDAQFTLEDFAGARESYRAVATGYTGLPAVQKSLVDRALYQIVRADLELHDTGDAERAMQQLLERFPDSELADNGLLLVGESFSDFSSPVRAREVFERFNTLTRASELKPQVELAVARTYEREQKWPVAVARYEAWIKNYPMNELLPQAQYARAWADFQAGNETNAFSLFSAFTVRFPTNELAPLAQWWVADHFFREANYVGAETNYEFVFQNPTWKGSTLFYPAQLMAGRAAAARLGFSDAARYFTGLTGDTNCPSALATQAMFAYGSVLMRMDPPDANRPLANFELATNVFAQICAANPTNEFGAQAGSELGDCCLQLGAFDAATNIYAQVAGSPYAGTGLRSRARVGLGLALEKKAALLSLPDRPALLKAALDTYRDVLYTTNDVADPFWVKKAGLQALPLMMTLKDGNVDKFFERLEHWLPQLKDSLEKKKLSLGVSRN